MHIKVVAPLQNARSENVFGFKVLELEKKAGDKNYLGIRKGGLVNF